MKKRKYGFTLIELLIVITIIGMLAGILLPVLISSLYRAKKARVKTTITQISQALSAYQNDEGAYPPNETSADDQYKEKNGGSYEYYSCTLIPYLDGDTYTTSVDGKEGKSRLQYMEFKEGDIEEDGSYLTYKDEFDTTFWYRNFEGDNMAGKVKDPIWPYHPNYNAYSFKTFQIYSKIDKEDEIYLNNKKKESHFQWITNYTRK